MYHLFAVTVSEGGKSCKIIILYQLHRLGLCKKKALVAKRLKTVPRMPPLDDGH